jgi:hypothetical protein
MTLITPDFIVGIHPPPADDAELGRDASLLLTAVATLKGEAGVVLWALRLVQALIKVHAASLSAAAKLEASRVGPSACLTDGGGREVDQHVSCVRGSHVSSCLPLRYWAVTGSARTFGYAL